MDLPGDLGLTLSECQFFASKEKLFALPRTCFATFKPMKKTPETRCLLFVRGADRLGYIIVALSFEKQREISVYFADKLRTLVYHAGDKLEK